MLRIFAELHSLTWKQDQVGNLVIYRKGSGGGELARPVLIQGHVDMVCAKIPSATHNFFTDPIKLVRDGDWLRADGTTLGADNGIGVAAVLALLELPRSAKLPPLECLFTVDEETGLTGAFSFDASLVRPLRPRRAPACPRPLGEWTAANLHCCVAPRTSPGESNEPSSWDKSRREREGEGGRGRERHGEAGREGGAGRPGGSRMPNLDTKERGSDRQTERARKTERERDK